MKKLNKMLTHQDFKDCQNYVKKIRSHPNPQHSQNIDAIVKWSSILEAVDILDFKPKTVMDVGSGGSHLSLCFVDEGAKAIVIDNRRLPEVCQGKENVECILDSFYSCAPTLPENSVDLIFDGCALTHFVVDGNQLAQVACFKAGKEIHRLLSPEGYFVCVSDVKKGVDSGQFVDPLVLKDAFERAGLVSVEEDIALEGDLFSYNGYEVVRLVFKK